MRSLAECDPAAAEKICENAGLAIPLQINFAVSGAARLIREIRAALHRREREQTLARRAAAAAIEAELKTTVAGLLLHSQLALNGRRSARAVADRLRMVADLAGNLRQQLSAPLDRAKVTHEAEAKQRYAERRRSLSRRPSGLFHSSSLTPSLPTCTSSLLAARKYLPVPDSRASITLEGEEPPMTVIRQEDFIASVAGALQYISYYHPVDYITSAWPRPTSASSRRRRATPWRRSSSTAACAPKVTGRSARTRAL